MTKLGSSRMYLKTKLRDKNKLNLSELKKLTLINILSSKGIIGQGTKPLKRRNVYSQSKPPSTRAGAGLKNHDVSSLQSSPRMEPLAEMRDDITGQNYHIDGPPKRRNNTRGSRPTGTSYTSLHNGAYSSPHNGSISSTSGTNTAHTHTNTNTNTNTNMQSSSGHHVIKSPPTSPTQGPPKKGQFVARSGRSGHSGHSTRTEQNSGPEIQNTRSDQNSGFCGSLGGYDKVASPLLLIVRSSHLSLFRLSSFLFRRFT